MKDWRGNKRSTWSTLGASNHSEYERENNDYYATDPRAIEPLFENENFTDVIWEPACGEGHLSKAMEEYGKTIVSQDLIDRGYGEGGIDFLQQDENTPCNWDIITNPPYKYAQEFVEKAIKLQKNSEIANLKVAMFLKLTFLEGQKRRKMFEKYPPKAVYVFSKRIQVAINGDKEMFEKSSAACYAWFVWEKDYKGEPIIRWI